MHKSTYILACDALDSDINQTAGQGDNLSVWKNQWMNVTVCLLYAIRPTSSSDTATLGESWTVSFPFDVKGLNKFLSTPKRFISQFMIISQTTFDKNENCLIILGLVIFYIARRASIILSYS